MNTMNLNVKAQEKQEITARESGRTDLAYVELPGLRHETRDVLKSLESNIQLLEDAGGRLSYVLSEVRTLIRR